MTEISAEAMGYTIQAYKIVLEKLDQETPSLHDLPFWTIINAYGRALQDYGDQREAIRMREGFDKRVAEMDAERGRPLTETEKARNLFRAIYDDEIKAAKREARAAAIEEVAQLVEQYPDTILAMWDRPGGPPGNGMRPSKPADCASAIRALADATPPTQPAPDRLDEAARACDFVKAHPPQHPAPEQGLWEAACDRCRANVLAIRVGRNWAHPAPAEIDK